MEWRETRLASVERCGADVLLLGVERPRGFSFEAGQWLRLEFETADGPQARTLSIASAPQESRLELATRLSPSAFKRALAELPPGSSVRIAGPGGRLRLSADVREVGLLAGGVGITPIRSILRSRMLDDRPFDDAALLFGNRDTTCIPYARDLEDLNRTGVRISHVPENPPAGWTGESGRIDAEMIGRLVDSPTLRPWMVAGPPPMVHAMEAVLDELGVSEDRRLIERFGPAVG